MPTRIVNFRWDDDLVALVDAAAKNAGLTRTKWVEQTLRNAVQEPATVATVATPERSSETPKRSPAPAGYIHERDCPHPWSAYRRPKEGLYCSLCRKFVIEEE